MEAFATIHHTVDFCVVGGGLAGLCAAVAAARHGATVALMQERPMLGGNASSEIRMWVCGAQGSNMRETGLVEELMMENQYRNANRNYHVWDSILYELARNEPNITLLLNCTCNQAVMDGQRIHSVRGWQMTTQQYHEVTAKLFADCSGDSVLAPLTGAMFRLGREARHEFDEDIAPGAADKKTMGMSCMLQAREEATPSEFVPPAWAYKYTTEDLMPYRVPRMEHATENFWYLELGGDRDAIADTETLRDELLKTAYGMWDYVKNAPENREKNRFWRLDWVGMLPGKRESRRYVGPYIMHQRDVRAGGRFDDVVAYGGWPMDDHVPAGFLSKEKPTVYHAAPSPYGIPYRCLYSANVDNLMFAGRNISVTHAALSSTRVMGTCALLGQAAGTAAALAARHGTTPHGVYSDHLEELQRLLMDDDCYLPCRRREIPAVTADAVLTARAPDAENLRNGLDRPIDGGDNGAHLPLHAPVTYTFGRETHVRSARIVFDSDLDRLTLAEADRGRGMLHNRPLHWQDSHVPHTMTRAYRLEGILKDGSAVPLYETDSNYKRLNRIALDARVWGVRLIPLATWGSDTAHVFSFDVG